MTFKYRLKYGLKYVLFNSVAEVKKSGTSSGSTNVLNMIQCLLL